MKDFKEGDVVEWTSSYRKKEGVIVAVVEANRCPLSVYETIEGNGYRFAAYGGGMPRTTKSYLVALPPKPNGTIQQLFWPNVNLLKRV